MSHTPDPYLAFLTSLQDAYSASGQPGGPSFGGQDISSFGQAGSEGPPGVSGTAGVGAGGGSVPGTATTGQSLLQSILGGGSGPLEQDLMSRAGVQGLFDRDGPSDPSGASLGEFDNLQGGDLGMLSSILQLGPLAPALLLGQLVFDDASGESFASGIGSRGIANEDRESGFLPSTLGNEPTAPSSNIGSGGISFADREMGFFGSGASPRRGTISNAGR